MEQTPAQEAMSEREKTWTELVPIFEKLKRHIEFGGYDDAEGALQPGKVDVDELKEEIRKVVLGVQE